MDALDAVLTRRSIRRYSDSPVSEALVTQLLRAAMAAPSARNQQPWRFIVVRDRAQLAALATAQPNAGMVGQAQVAVVVCADLDLVKSEGFWVQDCAAATENLLIAAHALGLGAVWSGTYPREERVARVGEVVGLPANVVAFAVVPIGYPAEHPAPAERFDSERIHLDHYQEGA
ncbi:MAG: NADH dehydrogenase [Actinobacteria bacterium RBG_13_63_9]|nr:MAG: NADH dehydrogenase [Actinobacteria bacterium RBG_13_63_9]